MILIDREHTNKECSLAIVGGGPAGLSAAARAWELGIKDIMIIEREPYLGGILPQCIHSGFGTRIFNEELTGPEYAQRFIDLVKKTKIKIIKNTFALSIDKANKKKIRILTTNKYEGLVNINAKSLVLATGCRERTRGQILIPGNRPAGVFTAGFIQRLVNIEGYLPGKKIVILGSGDIGLIMARRLKLEGCEVQGVFELMPFSTGLKRNIVQCLDDYDIPLYLSHTVTKIEGRGSLSSVIISRVDNKLKPIKGTERKIKCDTLLLSVGLIPENELAKTAGILIDANTQGPEVDENFQTNIDGIFSCGNSLFVNDLVDNVTDDAFLAAEKAFAYMNGKIISRNISVRILPGENIAQIIPQKIYSLGNVSLWVRAKIPLKNAVFEIFTENIKDGFDKKPDNIIENKILFSKKLRFVFPGELIKINIAKDDFKDIADAASGFDIKALLRIK